LIKKIKRNFPKEEFLIQEITLFHSCLTEKMDLPKFIQFPKEFMMSQNPHAFYLRSRNNTNVGRLILANLDDLNYPPVQGGAPWPRPETPPPSPGTSWIINQCAAVMGPELSKLNYETLTLSKQWKPWPGNENSFYQTHRESFEKFGDMVDSLRQKIFLNVLGPGATINISPLLEWPLVPLGEPSKTYDIAITYQGIPPADAHFTGQFIFTQDVQNHEPVESWGVILDYAIIIQGPVPLLTDDAGTVTMQTISSSSSSKYSTQSSSP
jgi:hypothetical protein